jgi:transposase
MRGNDRQPDAMFSYVSAEQRVPKAHPLRAIRALVDEVLRDMSREFDGLYARMGRPSIPPERLLRAQLLQIFYSVRSERLLMEQLDYNLLFRWFVGMDTEGWRHGRGWARLPRTAAKERHACLEDRPRRAVVSKIERRRIALGVSRPPVDRESPWPDCRRHGDHRGRHRGARGRDLDGARAVAARAAAPPHAGRRQGVRHLRLRGSHARAEHHAARRARSILFSMSCRNRRERSLSDERLDNGSFACMTEFVEKLAESGPRAISTSGNHPTARNGHRVSNPSYRGSSLVPARAPPGQSAARQQTRRLRGP